MKDKVLIAGITGQDGSYLAELLLEKGYEVHGIIRRHSTFATERIDHIFNLLKLYYGDLADAGRLTELIYSINPRMVFNLAAQSHVKTSFDIPDYTGDITGLGTTRLLEAIRKSGIKTKFYQASSSEIFGTSSAPQSELTKIDPRSPYAAAKAYAYYMTKNYREAYNMFACNGILFNHESPRRLETFVTRKITKAVARIKFNKQKSLILGNINAVRDWGYAPDYVKAMLTILEQDKPDDFVIGTGESHSVREFLEEAFSYVDLDWKDFVSFNKKYLRPTEVDYLQADISKAKKLLSWQPTICFKELVHKMVDADLKYLKNLKIY